MLRRLRLVHEHDGIVGECRRSAPVPATERYGMLGIQGTSYPLLQAGHI